jgi:hypothetical protein
MVFPTHRITNYYLHPSIFQTFESLNFNFLEKNKELHGAQEPKWRSWEKFLWHIACIYATQLFELGVGSRGWIYGPSPLELFLLHRPIQVGSRGSIYEPSPRIIFYISPLELFSYISPVMLFQAWWGCEWGQCLPLLLIVAGEARKKDSPLNRSKTKVVRQRPL